MGGQKFQYDESGGTFFYFLLSFLALLLLPGTYYWWPRKRRQDPETIVKECQCDNCKKKRLLIQSNEPWKGTKQLFIKLLIISGWVSLILLAYKVSQFDYEYANFDPYEILGVPLCGRKQSWPSLKSYPSTCLEELKKIMKPQSGLLTQNRDSNWDVLNVKQMLTASFWYINTFIALSKLGSSQAEIRKSYRKLSLILHPDKETGNEKAFMKLTKAYQALTDDEARRNWEKYGNPDGPGAMSFGIALPSWIVEKENSVWVLGLYALVFMVALPTVVGMWWYRSIRYTGDQVLLSTTEMYYHYFHKTPSMALKRVIMILAASLEFEKRHNGEIVERPTDNEEVPHLIKQIPNLSEKNRERPLCFMYSIKARALLHAHLHRIPLNPETLDKDRQYIVKKCPYLIQEMVNCVSHLILLGYARRVQHFIHIETIENCMKLCPLVVQGMWEYKSPLLQLPHITEDNLKYFSSKKRHIKSIQQVAQLKHEERRHMLRNLSDEQYEDIMKVIGKMPYVDFQIRSEVIDDENPTVYTAGAIVTVTVTLIRQNMSVLFGDESVTDKHEEQDASSPIKGEEEEEDVKKETVARKPVWQKQQKKSKKGGKKSAKNQKSVSKTVASRKNDDKKSDDKKSEDKISNAAEAALGKQEISRKTAADTGEESEGSNDDAYHSDDDDDDQHSQGDKASVEDDDTEWEKFQEHLSKREKVLEGKSKRSHTVHCPLYPEDKQEYWWVYISDRKSRTLLTPPYHVTALVEQEEVQLKFTAPRWPGVYTFTVCLRSDSYLGFDQMHDLKLDVKEAPEVPTEHPQWDMLDDEEEVPEGGGSDVSEFTTDEDVEDE